MAAETAACRCLSAQHPNLLQRVLTMHLLMLNRPRPHRPLMRSGSGTTLRRDLLQTLRGLRPYIAFPLHLGGTAGPLGGAGGCGGDTRCDPCRALCDPTGPGGLYKCKALLFSRG